MARALLQWTLGLALLGGATLAQAQVYVATSQVSVLRTLTRKDVVNLYTGRTRSLEGGPSVVALDLPRDDALRGEMYRLLTGFTPAQINSYWSRLTFTGQTRALPVVASEAQMTEALRANPSAIGYLSREPTDKALRVLMVLKEP